MSPIGSGRGSFTGWIAVPDDARRGGTADSEHEQQGAPFEGVDPSINPVVAFVVLAILVAHFVEAHRLKEAVAFG